MNQTDEFLWTALEGALGAEKVASLRYAPLHEIVPDGRADFSVADAAGHIAKKASALRQERQSIQSGLKALNALGVTAKTATKTTLSEKIALAHKLRIAEQYTDKNEAVKTASYRHALNEDIVNTIKQAAIGGVLDGVSKNPLFRDMGKKMLQAGAVGTGLAIPGYAAGSALSDTFTEDARNRALQTAAGVGGMGMLGYAGMQAMGGRDNEKMSSVNLGQVLPQEKAAHLATAVYLDELLDSVDQTEKVAGLRRLNREFIVEELLSKAAEDKYQGPIRKALGLPSPQAHADAYHEAGRAATHTRKNWRGKQQKATGKDTSVLNKAKQVAQNAAKAQKGQKAMAKSKKTTTPIVGKSSGKGPGGATK